MRRFFKFLGLCLTGLVLAAMTFAFLALQDQPSVTQSAAPTPENVQDARRFLRSLRTHMQTAQNNTDPFTVTQRQLNSVLALGARFVPGFRGQIEIGNNRLTGAISIPMPYTDSGWWLNLRASAPAFTGRFALDTVSVGDIPLPPKPALWVGRVLLNTVLGNNLGDTILSAATAMHVEGDVVSFDLAIDNIGKNGVMRGVFGTLRGSDMPDTAEIDRYYTQLRRAMDRGELPTEGSYLPYLQFTLNAAYEGSRTEGISNAYTAALFALTRACGARDFTMVVGGLAGAEQTQEPDWKHSCENVTLNGRIDSRRHFTTAAALQAASNRGFAVSIGEFKELYDSLKITSGGFDFTDLAANNSGIRMSNMLMAVSRNEWPALLARIETENDLIIPFDDVPQIMSRDRFRQQYGDIDSPQYTAMLLQIEAIIDTLALHR